MHSYLPIKSFSRIGKAGNLEDFWYCMLFDSPFFLSIWPAHLKETLKSCFSAQREICRNFSYTDNALTLPHTISDRQNKNFDMHLIGDLFLGLKNSTKAHSNSSKTMAFCLMTMTLSGISSSPCKCQKKSSTTLSFLAKLQT